MSAPSSAIGLVLRIVRRERLSGMVPYLVRWVRRRAPSRKLIRIRAGEEFDRQFRISTGGSITIASVHDAESLYYEPTAPYAFSAMISRLPAEAVAHSTFVDVGCGRGRALVMAAESGFRKLVGIELSRELYLDACQNVERYQSSGRITCTIKLDNIDACDYRLPDSACVIFFYNTLGPASMRRFVAIVEQSLARNPRDLFVVYHNPEWRRIWDESPLFSRLAADIWSPDWYVIYCSARAESKAAIVASAGE